MNIRDWDPSQGDALQGDVCLFRLPDHITVDTSDEITPDNHRLVIAAGEVTGHHHAIYLPQPVMFRDDGLARGITLAETNAMIADAVKRQTGTARLYRDPKAVRQLIDAGELTTERLAIGILVVEGGPVCLVHDEHDAIRIPPGRYYVGGQAEFDVAEMRRVAD